MELITVPPSVHRPRFFSTVRRGALYGLAAIPPAGLVALFLPEREERKDFLAVVGGLGMLFSVVSLGTGLLMWLVVWGDVLRWRDVRSELEKYPRVGRLQGVPAVQALAPTLVRLGVLLGIMGLGLMLLYYRVEAAPDGSWLCCRGSGD